MKIEMLYNVKSVITSPPPPPPFVGCYFSVGLGLNLFQFHIVHCFELLWQLKQPIIWLNRKTGKTEKDPVSNLNSAM